MKVVTGKSDEIEGFWQMMGPFFASRKLVKERGDFLYDDKGTVWFVACVGLVVLGFCFVRILGARCLLASNYVVAKYRGQGVFSELNRERESYIIRNFGGYTLETVVKDMHLKKMLQKGFSVVNRRGSWYVLRRKQIKGELLQ